MKLRELAERLQCRVEGNPDVEISAGAGIEKAKSGQLTFLDKAHYRAALLTTRASAVLIGEKEVMTRDASLPPISVLRSANPRLDFTRALELLYPAQTYAPGIHPTAVVSKSAGVSKDAHVGPYCFVDDGAEVGPHSVLHSFVTLYRGAKVGGHSLLHSQVVVRDNCVIGDRVILQSGVVIGGDGFGFVKEANGIWRKTPQTGITVIEDDVEIQANTCVDRATVGETRIERGAKIDDLVMVGHACEVGEDTLLCGQVGLAGTTHVGKHCILAGQVGAGGHLKVGDGATITAQSGIPSDIPAGGFYSGYPAMENKLWLKCMAAVKTLPDLLKRVRQLRADVDRLNAQAASR
ncbi:MAG TPA: UDP-3-O-(3-hydroxymyristoyl)glucosamine N-acyltransferase [Methylomirabilota bacterium]|nr:UDP-3-O-(3-hydroxymyristoyl)glucosamine N-acyltransferase [Methylomirabilota bacterium]